MARFDNYQNGLNSVYIKSTESLDSFVVKGPNKPFEEKNALGETVGYFWYYGDTINIEFNIIGQITVEPNAIIYTTPSETPTNTTPGVVGQKAYNVADLISWTCTSIVDSSFTWVQDSTFTYPETGKAVYMTALDFIKDKQLSFKIFDFRCETVYESVIAGTIDAIFPINADLSKKLVKGNYTCSLTCFDEASSTYSTIIDNINLIVK